MPIHCHSCTCTKTTTGRQYGPDPKYIKIVIDGKETILSIRHPLYMLRYGLISRCYNASAREYKSYQGKGIKVCDEWRNDPISFYEWCLKNGWEKGSQIDRINSDGDYEPANCQFLTPSMHARKSMSEFPKPRNAKLDKEKAKIIRELLSQRVRVSEIASRFGVCESTIYDIKNHGLWS